MNGQSLINQQRTHQEFIKGKLTFAPQFHFVPAPKQSKILRKTVCL